MVLVVVAVGVLATVVRRVLIGLDLAPMIVAVVVSARSGRHLKPAQCVPVPHEA